MAKSDIIRLLTALGISLGLGTYLEKYDELNDALQVVGRAPHRDLEAENVFLRNYATAQYWLQVPIGDLDKELMENVIIGDLDASYYVLCLFPGGL